MEQYENDQQTNIFFEKLFRKKLQVNVIDKIETESPCNVFTKNLDETKKEPFIYV